MKLKGPDNVSKISKRDFTKSTAKFMIVLAQTLKQNKKDDRRDFTCFENKYRCIYAYNMCVYDFLIDK